MLMSAIEFALILHIIKLLSFSAFKACHPKIKTFYFAAENIDDMSRWVYKALISELHPQCHNKRPIVHKLNFPTWLPTLFETEWFCMVTGEKEKHTHEQDHVFFVLECVTNVFLPHRWLSRLSMAVAGYSEQEQMRQDQGEISHRACSSSCRNLFLLVMGQQQMKWGVMLRWERLSSWSDRWGSSFLTPHHWRYLALRTKIVEVCESDARFLSSENNIV